MAQITFFSQLSEVQLNDWTVQELKPLTLNTYEFVTILNDYCDRLSEDATFFDNDPSRRYLENCNQKFPPENAILDSKIDTLEARTTRLKGQITGANTRLIHAPQSSFNNKLAENFVANKPLSNPNKWKSFTQTISVENIDADERKSVVLTNEILPVEVIKKPTIPTKNIAFNQLFYGNDCLNIGLFWLDSYSVESSISSLVNCQTNQAIAYRSLARESWGFPTNQGSNSDFKWNGFINKETITKPNQKGDIQVLSLEVILAFQNPVIQGDLSKIFVNIKLI